MLYQTIHRANCLGFHYLGLTYLDAPSPTRYAKLPPEIHRERHLLSSPYHIPMSSPIRTAVIGYGLAGRVFHCPFVHAVPGLELAAIVVSNPDRAAQAREHYPYAPIVPRLETVLADPTIDLIVVATPNESHFDIAKSVLLAGKHVVIDKPITTSAAEARELIDLATKQGKILAPYHNRRFDCDFLTVRKLLAENTLGRVTEVTASFDRFRPLVRPNTWKESGFLNGLLYDLGPHLIDQALALFGPPARLTAFDTTIRDITDIDDFMQVTLEYDIALPSGETRQLFYTCHASMIAADPSPRFRVHGTLGTYTKQSLDPQEAALIKGQRPPELGSPEPWLPEPESSWGTLTLGTRLAEPVELSRNPFPSVTGDYRLYYANVRDAINGTAPLIVPTEDGYRVLRLLDLARESAKTRRTLDVTF
jgi:scyllo-inositol 2-dehydrogenase (NADP+)